MGVITSFGYWVRRQRKALDLTQAALAKQVGCAVVTIKKIERDERRPSLEMAELLAQHLAISEGERQDFLDMGRGRYVDEVEPPTSLVESPPSFEIPHNLPPQPTPFIGREEELNILDDLLNIPEVRLITIVGPGGMGKTRLALACAGRFVGTQRAASLQSETLFPKGVFFVPLAPLSDPEHIIPAIAEAFDLPLESGGQQRRTPKQQLLTYLQKKRTLLVLDNFEHLLDEALLASDILQAAPDVKILGTSRERLRLYEEQVFAIDGLAFPDWETSEDAESYTAVQLFIQSARRINYGFQLQTDNLTFLTRICRLVDGMPLGIELAAGWVDALSLEQIAAEIQKSLDFLESGMRNMPDRHRSMRATFDYSWQRLGKRDQKLFAQLSIFRGGFTRQAGQAVTGASLRRLSRLVNKSFIQFNKEHGRYAIHELMRQYGAEHLSLDAEAKRMAVGRYSTYFCNLLGDQLDNLKGADQKAAVAVIEADIDNIRLAWSLAIDQQKLPALSVSMEALFRFYWQNFWWSQGLKLFKKAETALRTREATGERGIVLGRLLAFLARFYRDLSQYDEAKKSVLESLNILQKLGAREESLWTLFEMGGLADSIEESNQILAECVSLAREFDDALMLALALNRMGTNAYQLGDFQSAEEHLRDAVERFLQNGDLRDASWALGMLSNIARDRGQYQESLTLAQEAMTLIRESSLPPLQGYLTLGSSKLALGKYVEAQKIFEDALTLTTDLGLISGATFPNYWLGKVAFHQGDYKQAAHFFRQSLDLALEFEYDFWVARNHNALGNINLAQGAKNKAEEHFRIALQSAIINGQPMLLLDSIINIAELYTEQNKLESAGSLLHLSKNHPASRARTKERAAKILVELEKKRPPKNLNPAIEQLELLETASSVLKEMSELSDSADEESYT